MTHLYIKIPDPILRCYLGTLFKPRDGGYAVTMETLTGVAICSQARESQRPITADAARDRSVVKLFLPQSYCVENLRGRFVYLPAPAQMMVNAALKKEFDIHFLTYCTEMRMQGHKLRDIIPLFIDENKLDVFDGDIETLKKRYYRKEVELLRKLNEKLRQKANYLLRKSKNTRKMIATNR